MRAITLLGTLTAVLGISQGVIAATPSLSIESERATTTKFIQEKDQKPTPAKISTELEELFSSAGCPLPDAIEEVLKKNGQLRVPKELQGMLGADYNSEAKSLYSFAAQAVLARSFLTPSSGEPSVELTLAGSDVYSNLDPMRFADTTGGTSMFTMDCSGYLNAALSLDTGSWLFPVKTKDAASAALSRKTAIVVIRAMVFSPVANALYPSLASSKLTTSEKLDVLYAILSEAYQSYPGLDAKSAEVSSLREISMIWTSNQGSTSFQGQTSLSSSASAGFAGANAQASIGVGGGLSRGVTFTSFNTYVINDALLSSVRRPFALVIDDFNKALKNEVDEPDVNFGKNGSVTATFADIPKSICIRGWTASTSTIPDLGRTKPSYDKSVCTFKVTTTAKNLEGADIRLTPVDTLANVPMSLTFKYPSK